MSTKFKAWITRRYDPVRISDKERRIAEEAFNAGMMQQRIDDQEDDDRANREPQWMEPPAGFIDRNPYRR